MVPVGPMFCERDKVPRLLMVFVRMYRYTGLMLNHKPLSSPLLKFGVVT